MKKQKEYSTLKVQQEIIKTYFKGETHCVGFAECKMPCNEIWYMYKAIALYKAEKPMLNNLREVNCERLINDLGQASNMLSLNEISYVTDGSNLMIKLSDKSGFEHKIDKKLLDIVNLDVYHCNFYVPALGKPGIVAVRDADNKLLAGIMEVK